MPILTKRSVGLMILDVSMASINSDPDWSNEPRRLENSHGFATDVSWKRHFRDLFENHDSPIFQQIVKLCKIADPNRFWILESLGKGFNQPDLKENKKLCLEKSKNYAQFLDYYFDSRVFGCTLLEGDDEDDKTAMKRTGCVTVTPFVSICPIEIVSSTITKKAPLRDSLLEGEGHGDMAPAAKKVVQHGLYVARVVVNPHHAQASMTTEEDIEVFKKTAKFAYTAGTSTVRPGGSINCLHFWWADHDNSLGSFNEFAFWDKLTPKAKNPDEPSESLNDYVIPTPEECGFEFAVVDLA